MATYSAKFYTKNKAGTNQAHNIYSTGNEAGGQGGYFAVKVDSAHTGYVALTTNSSVSTITSGRCKSSDGTTWYMCSEGVPNYYSVLITWSGKFTVPTGVTVLRLTLIGGGAGGYVAATSKGPTTNGYGPFDTVMYGGVAGGTTTFGTLSAAGGTDPNVVCRWNGSYDEGNWYYSWQFRDANASTGHNNGVVYWDASPHDGPGNISITNYAGTVVGYAGAGGSADSNSSLRPSFTGATGSRLVTRLAVTPGDVLAYSVGGGGAGNRAGTYTTTSTGGMTVGNGTAGAILLEYGIGIQ